MELHLKFWTYATLTILGIVCLLLTIYAYHVGQYESFVKLMILGIIAFAGLLLCIWVWKK